MADEPGVAVTCAIDPTGRDPIEVDALITVADGRWEARAHFRLDDGQLVCRRLEVGAEVPGVTSGFLRQIPMGTIMTAVRNELTRLSDRWATAGDVATAGNLRPEQRKRGRRGYSDAHYETIARDYLALQREHNSRGLLDKLADHLSQKQGKELSRETVRDWVKGARKRGFLSPASPGRPGALPGSRLRPE